MLLYIHISNLVWPAVLAAVGNAGGRLLLRDGFRAAWLVLSARPIIRSPDLTLSTLLIAALLMVSLGVSGPHGVAAVLGVAAVVCISSSVAGELLQDFKVGYILGGTPRRIQIAELVAVVVASLVMYWPLYLLNKSFGFGSRQLSAPQAGLMATLAIGIVGGDMPWPLVVVGVFFGIALIMMQVKSPMLVAVGMYLPFETTFAIFLGGVFRALSDGKAKKRGYNQAQHARVENAAVLTPSALIVGESLLGLGWAGVVAVGQWRHWTLVQAFSAPSYVVGLVVLICLAALMIRLQLTSACDPSVPAPPTAMM